MDRILITLAKYFLPLLLLAGAGHFTMQLIKNREKPTKEAPSTAGILVETVTLHRGDHPLIITGMGTVVPARSVAVQPEVSGRIVDHHPALVVGGRLAAGAELARIDDRNYQLALAGRRAELARARYELKLEEGRQAVAKREWDLLGAEVKQSGTSKELALRIPHLANVKAALAAAEANLAKAELDLSRVLLRVPFNAIVQREGVEKGQLVSPQSQLATLAGTDTFWVEVSVPIERLERIRLPDRQGKGASQVRVTQETGTATAIVRQGRVIRLLGELDPVGRMARIVVAIDDPLGLKADKKTTPLLLGAYVKVEIDGGTMSNVFSIPRTALRQGDRVWVMTAESKLEIIDIRVHWRDRERIFLANSMQDGSRLITSTIPIPAKGMKLRIGKPTGSTAGKGSDDKR